MSCPPPFLAEVAFPESGGILSGRFCMPVALLNNASCCLPCPITEWTYPDGFESRTEIANWVNVAAFCFSVFLLVSFVVLPVKYTHRHYLSVCLTLGVVFMELAFIIPLATKPDQCFNEITPNDMHTSGSCAISGAFLLFGGWAAVIWVFIRALALHLQICWEVVMGNKFFYSTLAAGWLIPIIGLTLALSLTGVSFRFGNVCHINHSNSLQDFWGPLLAFAALALVLQFITIGYCIQVYIKSLLDDKTTTNSSAPTYSGSVRTITARQAYRRVKRVIQLQWRGASVVLVIIGEVVFFSVIFVSMDNSTQVNDELLARAAPWLSCLLTSSGDKNLCLPLADGLLQSEGIVMAVLIVLGLSGFWLLIFLGRISMFAGWKDLVASKLTKKNEFVSADARRLSNDPRTYEMLSGKSMTPNGSGQLIKSPDRALSPGGRDRDGDAKYPRDFKSPLSPLNANPFTPTDIDSKGEYFNTITHSTSVRSYNNPAASYSYPTPPERSAKWDPRSTHASPGNDIGRAYSPGQSYYR